MLPEFRHLLSDFRGDRVPVAFASVFFALDENHIVQDAVVLHEALRIDMVDIVALARQAFKIDRFPRVGAFSLLQIVEVESLRLKFLIFLGA